MTDQDAVEQMWRAFRQATGSGSAFIGAFGDSPAMADELADLVLNGPKRATAGLLVGYERDGEPVPKPDDHSVVLGVPFSDDLAVVFERFEVVWPR